MVFKINDTVTWVGKIDWEIRKFHGEEYSTNRGTSYNSYLVKDSKIALIDTVWMPFGEEFVKNLKKELDLKKIDYIIANHAEIDHSGGLKELMKEIPNTPVYCTERGLKSFKGHFHQNWNFKTVKTGDRLNLGSKELIFIEAPMLHWPDSMFCYLTKDGFLFSNDAFGQHLAAESMYNDLVDQCELFQEAIKYYANILTPFSKLVTAKIDEVLKLNLPVNMILPSHGVLWRKDPVQIVKKYLDWSKAYQENQITILYDTMWNGTRRMAEAISEGIGSADSQVNIKIYNVARSDKTEVIAEIFKSKTILIGSPTINRGVLFSVAGLLDMIKGLKFQNKKAASFGCYGWSGESIKLISEKLAESGFDILNEGIRAMWNPEDGDIEKCIEFGKKL